MTNLTKLTSAALVSAISLAGIPNHALAADSGQPQYYELRVYTTKSEQQQKLVSDYWQNAAVPAYNRMGIQPVGVFTELEDSSTNKVYVLVPFDSLDVFAGIPARLASDAAYQAAAAEYMARPKSDPAYQRIESSLNVAFDSMKKLAVPPSTADKSPWIFELRTYESYSESKALKKVEMFNAGEIDVMHEVGLGPIFYGQALIGRDLPHLTYMTSGENDEVHKAHWDAFGKHPIWEKLKNDPQYAETVSKMTKWILVPTAYSQI